MMADQPTSPPRKKLYIETVGCQMNLLDSELVVAKLRNEGYELTDDLNQADAILYNTCSVRQHAEDKIYSALGRIKRLKERKPELTIGVLGCMAQKDQEAIFRRAPHVDIVVGPGQLAKVPEMLAQAGDHGAAQLAVSRARNGGSLEVDHGQLRELRRRSRAGDAAQSVSSLRPGHDGLRQVLHLLHRSRGARARAKPPARRRSWPKPGCSPIKGSRKSPCWARPSTATNIEEPDGRLCRLSDLLERIHDIAGIERIKFITNFPNDMTDDLLQAVRDLPKVSRYLHVPAQSGCDAILKRMKRMYTVAFYEEMLARVRETIPDVAVSSDFIVGFCGEDEASFERTVGLVERSRFKNSFIFKYSPRQGTKADGLYADDVPEAVKKRRNNDLLALQNAISLEDNRRWVGRTVEVLVEGTSRKAARRDGWDGVDQLTGRTACDRIAVFAGARTADRPVRAGRGRRRERGHPFRSGGNIRANRDSGVKG